MMLIVVLFCSLLSFERFDAHVAAGCLNESDQGMRLLCSSLEHLALMPDAEAAKIVVLRVECAKRMSKSDRTMLTVDFHKFDSLRILSVVNCSLAEVEEFIFEGNYMLESVDFSNNSLAILRWQSMAHARSLSSINLRNNQLSCDCRNEWLKTDGVESKSWYYQREMFHLPIKVYTDMEFETKCKFNNCPHSMLQPLRAVVNAQIGESFELRCNLHGGDELKATKYDAFEWIYASLRHIHMSSIRIENKSMSIRIENATSNEVGIVICKCWSCRMPIFGSIQVRIPTNLSARIVESHLPELIIHGYPLDELKIEVYSVSTQINDSSPLLETTSLLNDSINLRLELEQSQFFVHYYSLYYTPCINCLQYSGIFIFNICSLQSCTSIEQQLHSSHQQMFQSYFDGQDISKHRIYTWALIVVILVLFLASVSSLGAFLYVKRLLRSESWKRRKASRNTDETSMPLEDASFFSSDYRLVPIIDRDAIKLQQKIGHGAFGEVFSADWSGSPTGRVAIKILHHVKMDAEMSKEAHLLSQLEHPNIVRLFGVARDRHQILLVLELISLGDLKSYVRARVPLCKNYSQFPPALTNDELLNICIQICHGLCYLNSQQIVHRDLAARNCLISGESDMKICDAAQRPPFTVKISDFGMSRRLYSQTEYYRMNSTKTVLPIRWLAPECIQYYKFTHASDIWAYGVTIWEVYTYGEVPFGELSNGEVLSALLNGTRLSKPKNAPANILQIMDDCWEFDAEKRPLCIDILSRLTLCQ